jgi:hypothetical protein
MPAPPRKETRVPLDLDGFLAKLRKIRGSLREATPDMPQVDYVALCAYVEDRLQPDNATWVKKQALTWRPWWQAFHEVLKENKQGEATPKRTPTAKGRKKASAAEMLQRPDFAIAMAWKANVTAKRLGKDDVARHDLFLEAWRERAVSVTAGEGWQPGLSAVERDLDTAAFRLFGGGPEDHARSEAPLLGLVLSPRQGSLLQALGQTPSTVLSAWLFAQGSDCGDEAYRRAARAIGQPDRVAYGESRVNNALSLLDQVAQQKTSFLGLLADETAPTVGQPDEARLARLAGGELGGRERCVLYRLILSFSSWAEPYAARLRDHRQKVQPYRPVTGSLPRTSTQGALPEEGLLAQENEGKPE